MARVAAAILVWITRIEAALAVAALAIAALGICADVISRDFFDSGIFGVQKLAVYCCAVAALLGLSIVVHGGGHLRIAAIDSAFPASWRPMVGRLGDLISAAAFGYLGYFAVRFVMDTAKYKETDIILNFYLWKIQVVIPIVFFLAAFKFIVHAIYPSTKPAESMI